MSASIQASRATLPTNPYVGPRSFTRADSDLFFGREQEARDLLARVISERALLFYAQSGAGKSSLLNTRLIPGLQAEGFAVLPKGRVSGRLTDDVTDVGNIYMYNLLLSLNHGSTPPAEFAHLSLTDFLARLVTDDGETWVYDPSLPVEQAATVAASAAVPAGGPPPAQAPIQPYVLIIDQFEEILTTHPARWEDREGFFGQLDHAMRVDPNLWVVLTLREDYVAALDPYAPLMADRLRARFYMSRMGVDAALEAIREPAALGGRPFDSGVAEKLVEDLRHVRVPGQPGQEKTVPGQYVEPVQLQVVCYQLWENVKNRPAGPITESDLSTAGDVNQALTRFYEDTLAAVLADPDVQAAGVTERTLRTWFDKELITPSGIRNTVLRSDETGRTGSLPNAAVNGLERRYLLRTDLRGGGAWVELVHDRFVRPIRDNNAEWFPEHLSPLQQQAAIWESQGRADTLLMSKDALKQAQEWAAAHDAELLPVEREYLAKSADAIERERLEQSAKSEKRLRKLGWLALTETLGWVIGFCATILGVALNSSIQSWISSILVIVAVLAILVAIIAGIWLLVYNARLSWEERGQRTNEWRMPRPSISDVIRWARNPGILALVAFAVGVIVIGISPALSGFLDLAAFVLGLIWLVSRVRRGRQRSAGSPPSASR